MSNLTLKTVTRTQGNNAPLKDGSVKPKTFAFAFEEVDPLIAAFRRMVRGNEFDICEMAITTYICAKAFGKPMTAIPVFIVRGFHHGAILVNTKAGIRTPKDWKARKSGQSRLHRYHGVWAREYCSRSSGSTSARYVGAFGDEHVGNTCRPRMWCRSRRKEPLLRCWQRGIGGAIGVEIDHPDVSRSFPTRLEAGLRALRTRATIRSIIWSSSRTS